MARITEEFLKTKHQSVPREFRWNVYDLATQRRCAGPSGLMDHHQKLFHAAINQAVNNPTFRLTWRIEYDSPAV